MNRLAVISCFLALFLAAPAHGDVYRLDTGDRLRISVLGEANYPVEVSVDDAGAITLPMLGAVGARGHTTTSLAAEIRRAFAAGNLIIESFVHVDMAGYRPFFISGAVANAGAYPFTPGITVRHAIAIAGGFRALPAGDAVPALRIADLRSERAELLIEEFRHQIRLNRLQVEHADAGEFAAPLQIAPELSAALVNDITASEHQQLAARQAAFDNELAYLTASLERAREDAKMAALVLEDRTKALESQKRQFDIQRGLQGKGLATNTNVAAAERVLNSYQIDLSDAQFQQLRTSQDLMTLESTIRKKREDHELDILTQIQEAQIEIGKARSKLKHVTDKLLFLWSYGSQRSFDDLRPSMRISIHRRGPEGLVDVTASESTDIKAGDVIEIAIAPPETFYAPAAASPEVTPF